MGYARCASRRGATAPGAITPLQTAIASGKPPHLASFQGWEWQTYADRGLLAPLDELIARDGLDGIYTQDVAAIRRPLRAGGDGARGRSGRRAGG